MNSNNGKANGAATLTVHTNGKTNGTNGVKPASSLNDKILIVRPDTAAKVEPEKKAEEQKPIASPSLFLEAQRHRMDVLNSLFEKQDKLTETKNTLRNFKLGADENTSRLELTDSKGKNFKTGNPAILADVIEQVMGTIDKKLAETNEQILAA